MKRGPADNSIPITLGISTSDEVLHLGHFLRFDLSDSAEVMAIARSFNKQFHSFFHKFAKLRKRELLIPLFNTYCSSFYGLDAIFPHKASMASIRFLRKSVNLALMRLLNLPPESVSPYLIAEGILNIDTTWSFRSLCFWKNLMSGNHPCKDIIMSSFNGDIHRLGAKLGILPFSLSLMSRSKIKESSILLWMEEKLTL
jgi:hypothetical protein